MLKRVRITLLTLLLLLAILPAAGAAGQGNGPRIYVISADGALSQTMADYLDRGIQTAERNGAEALIFELNTPGGSIDLMNRMEQDILDSQVPVVVYVSPKGSMAGSAGSVITLAAQAAAMAPDTIIGAASPVSSTGQNLDSTEEAKTKQAMSATMRGLTERRGPEAVSIAVDMINNAKAVSATEAVNAKLVDFSATDLNDLLRQMNGFTVHVAGGTRVLNTTNAVVTTLPLTLIEQLLLILANPNIVFLLLQIGVLAVLIEISNPGGWVPGFIGVTCLALAGYGMGILPVNWFGLAFVVIAFVLFILDIKTPTHGALTAAGTASLIVGGLVLFNSAATPAYQRVSPWLVVVVSLLTAALFAVIVSFAVRAQHAPLRTGQNTLLGQVGTVRTSIAPHGTVQVAGELWSADLAQGQEALPAGSRVEVVNINGVKVVVRKYNNGSK